MDKAVVHKAGKWIACVFISALPMAAMAQVLSQPKSVTVFEHGTYHFDANVLNIDTNKNYGFSRLNPNGGAATFEGIGFSYSGIATADDDRAQFPESVSSGF